MVESVIKKEPVYVWICMDMKVCMDMDMDGMWDVDGVWRTGC